MTLRTIFEKTKNFSDRITPIQQNSLNDDSRIYSYCFQCILRYFQSHLQRDPTKNEYPIKNN